MANLLDGLIEVAPIIQTEISGGKLQLALGAHRDAASTERLIAKLRPR
jgi:hypothetical protein